MTSVWIGLFALCGIATGCILMLPHPSEVFASERGMLTRLWSTVVAALVVAAVAAMALSGCGASWQTVARGTVEASAVAVDTGDSALAIAIRADCTPSVADLIAGSPERVAAADGCLHAHHFDDALHAVDTADHALRAAQAAIDAADRAGSAHDWLKAAPCLVVSVRQVVDALTAAGVALPAEVLASLTALQAFAGACPAQGGT